MPRVVVRKGYRCLPGKRRDLLAALQRVDAVAAEAGWPRGRYLFVETKASGEPDVEVEFTFDSYGEMERLERQLREHLARAGGAAVGSAGQEFLIEPSSTRYLLLLDEAAAGTAAARRGAGPAAQPQPAGAMPSTAAGPAGGSAGRPARAAPPGMAAPAPEPPFEEPDDDLYAELPPEDEPGLTPAERRLRQLSQARAALDTAEQSVNVSEERRTRARQLSQPPGPGAVSE